MNGCYRYFNTKIIILLSLKSSYFQLSIMGQSYYVKINFLLHDNNLTLVFSRFLLQNVKINYSSTICYFSNEINVVAVRRCLLADDMTSSQLCLSKVLKPYSKYDTRNLLPYTCI